MSQKISFFLSRARAFFLLCLIMTSVNQTIVLSEEIRRVQSYKKVLPYNTIGYKFDGLKPFVQGIEFIGYYTDFPPQDEEGSKMFSHAQFALTPSVLDFMNLDHEYVLLVCTSEAAAQKKMAEIGAVPLRGNAFGMVLAQKIR